jgi:hypothetical protein
MSELPDLDEHATWKVNSRWVNRIKECGFGGDHLCWHQCRERRRLAAAPRFSLAPPPPGSDVILHGTGGKGISYDKWLKEQREAWRVRQSDPGIIDSIGVAETIELAKETFSTFAGPYLGFWIRETERYSEEFARWVDALRRFVVSKIGDLWSGEWHAAWFERACRQKVDESLEQLVQEWKFHARKWELQYLENPYLPLRLVTASMNSQASENLVSATPPTFAVAAGGLANPRAKHAAATEARKTTRKGDITLLRKPDGSLYQSVAFTTAENYAAIGARRRQQLMTEGVLKVMGKGLKRRITVESLMAYCPPTEEAK